MPLGKEFVGFHLGSAGSDTISRFAVIYRDIDCTSSSNDNIIIKSLSSTIGSRVLFKTGTQSDSSAAMVYDTTRSFCGTLTTAVSYSPPSTTPNLITGSTTWTDSNQKGTVSLSFLESSTKTDEGTYSVLIAAQFSAASSLVSDSGNYEYVGCSQASILSQDIPDFSVDVGATNSG